MIMATYKKIWIVESDLNCILGLLLVNYKTVSRWLSFIYCASGSSSTKWG